jgi:hypothetical protein
VNQAARVTLSSDKPAISVTGWLGPNGAVPTGGYGGWEIVSRPRRQGLTIWNGRDPFKMSLQLVLDGFIAQDPIEIECSSVERLALPATDLNQPPVVTISGAAVPHSDLPWVIDNITWEEAERDSYGRRLRQVLTIDFIRYVKDERLKEQKASARARAKGKVPSAS